VLSAVYDGPMDVVRDIGYEAVILEKVPNLEDGDAQVSPLSVRAGDHGGRFGVARSFHAGGGRPRPSGRVPQSDACAVTLRRLERDPRWTRWS
jgi:hypothetical protein